MYMPFSKKRFDVTRNRIHLVSLSCNAVPPVKYGGIELIVANLCEGLRELGCGVVCYSPGDIGISGVQHWRTLAEPAVHIKDGGVPNTREHLNSVYQGLKACLSPGDVIVFNHPDHYRYLKKKLGYFVRRRHFICEVAHWVDVGVAENAIYPSASLKKQIGKPGVVIPHGENMLFGTDTVDREDFLFFAGRITRDKGVDIALAAAKKLGIPLVLAGPLNDKAFSNAILSDDNATYLGELAYEELFPVYRKAKALVYMTQYTEPFGLTIIEAMAAGCPIITTGNGGTGETVVEGVTGYFCKTADDICKVYPLLGAIDSEQCIARAKDYTIEKMASSYLEYFTRQSL